MILLVVGLVAVIVVILIAVFLSIRLGRGDEHDDEPGIRSGNRDQRDEEDRWREPDGRDTGRSSQPTRVAGRGAGERHRSRDDDRGRSGEPAYSGARERGAARRTSDRDYAEPSRPARRDSSEYETAPARRRSGADDFPVADYPSMDFPSDEYAEADYPSREPGEYAADDLPSEELPAVPARSAKHPRPDADRPDSRRKTAAASAPGKSRSRQHRGKRDDDDDWPSSEWDKLSDEQYWAELSADKPLATMAKPAASAGPATAKPSPEKHETRAARTAAAIPANPDELSRARLAAAGPPGWHPPSAKKAAAGGSAHRTKPPPNACRSGPGGSPRCLTHAQRPGRQPLASAFQREHTRRWTPGDTPCPIMPVIPRWTPGSPLPGARARTPFRAPGLFPRGTPAATRRWTPGPSGRRTRAWPCSAGLRALPRPPYPAHSRTTRSPARRSP